MAKFFKDLQKQHMSDERIAKIRKSAKEELATMFGDGHLNNGNCFEFVYECQKCGTDVFCDVCHNHDLPRGDCNECARV